MRILLIHKFFRITGGNDLYFFETKRILESQGHEVACLSTADERNYPSAYSRYFVAAPVFRSRNPISRFSSIWKIVYSFEAKESVSKLISYFRPQVVQAFGIHSHVSPSVLDACRAARIPVALSCNDYKHICPNYKLYHHGRICFDCRKGKFYSAILNRCCHNSVQFSVASSFEAYIHAWLNLLRKNVHTFLFSSEHMASVTRDFWCDRSFRWKKLPNPFHSPGHQISELSDDYLLFFGRLIEEKGVDILLKAMHLVPEAKLVVIGDGPQERQLKNLATILNLQNVEFVGPRWGEELDRFLKRTRFVVVPSVWHENSPYVILQSFAVGKPVIGTNRGGIPELIRDREFGMIYAAEDPEALAYSIRYLWTNPARTREMGRAAKEFSDSQFNDNKFYHELINIYEDMLK